VTGAESYGGNFTEPVVELGPILMEDLERGVKPYPMRACNVLTLIAEMHQLMPAMIAEIRMLRAEVAEQTKSDEAA
jgi:hypothetical protein